MPAPKGYTLTQIVLHWAVFLLVAYQLVFGDAMSHAYRAMLREGAGATTAAWVHIVIGVAVAVFVLWRMAIKARRGAPAQPENEPAMLKRAADLTHLALYALLILLVASGGLAWFAGQHWAGEAHEVMKPVLIALVGLHVAGALYHQLVLKTDVLKRMGRPVA